MNSDDLRLSLKGGVIAILGAMAAGLLTPGSAALAQPDAAASPPTPTEAVTVFAPRVERRQVTGAGQLPGAPIEVVSFAHTVSFADLDLATQAGADEFRRRIYYGAIDACDQMEAAYPSNIYVPVPSSQNCPDNAVRAALPEANQIISAAKARAR
jgi:UrcA family protein